MHRINSSENCLFYRNISIGVFTRNKSPASSLQSLFHKTLGCSLIGGECIRCSMCVSVLTCMLWLWVSWISSCTFSQKGLSLKGHASFSPTALFILLLGFNHFPYTPSLPAGGRRGRHQVSVVNDNISAAVAF